jgi:hypothetical protein
MIKQGFLRDKKKDAGKVTSCQPGLLYEALRMTLYMCDSFIFLRTKLYPKHFNNDFAYFRTLKIQ